MQENTPECTLKEREIFDIILWRQWQSPSNWTAMCPWKCEAWDCLWTQTTCWWVCNHERPAIQRNGRSSVPERWSGVQNPHHSSCSPHQCRWPSRCKNFSGILWTRFYGPLLVVFSWRLCFMTDPPRFIRTSTCGWRDELNCNRYWAIRCSRVRCNGATPYTKHDRISSAVFFCSTDAEGRDWARKWARQRVKARAIQEGQELPGDPLPSLPAREETNWCSKNCWAEKPMSFKWRCNEYDSISFDRICGEAEISTTLGGYTVTIPSH